MSAAGFRPTGSPWVYTVVGHRWHLEYAYAGDGSVFEARWLCSCGCFGWWVRELGAVSPTDRAVSLAAGHERDALAKEQVRRVAAALAVDQVRRSASVAAAAAGGAS